MSGHKSGCRDKSCLKFLRAQCFAVPAILTNLLPLVPRNTPGKAFSYSDPETSSDSEEDALRRLNPRPLPPPDTLTIQAEDGPTIVGERSHFHRTTLKQYRYHTPNVSLVYILDAGTTSSSCTEEHTPTDQQQVNRTKRNEC